MKNVRKRLLMVSATILLAVLCCSCGSDESPQPFRVFVGGEDVLDTMNSGAKVPTVWINGTPKYLKASNAIANHFVKDVTYKDGHYYSTGYDNLNSGWAGKIWKDEREIHSFEEANANISGNSITVSGGNVYVAASKYDKIQNRLQAVLIKNSTETVLSSGSNTYAEAFAVAVSDNDVYVGGFDGNAARLWKNGIVIELPNSQNYRIKSIALVGTDVYALGECNCWEGAKVRYWKNGVSTDVTTESEIAFGYGLAVSGTDVYIAGADFVNNIWRAKVWKNDVGTVLTPAGIVGWARDIVVDGSTVYVAGEQLSSNTFFNNAMLWTDGVPSKLGTRRSRAFGVAISK